MALALPGSVIPPSPKWVSTRSATLADLRWCGGEDRPAILRPRPVGFPGCRLCPYRRLRRPDVCLACVGASAGQPRDTAIVRRCASCGGALRPPAPCGTRWCGREDRGWSVVFSVGVHTAGLQRAILRYKYGGEHWWAGVFGRLFAGYLEQHSPWFDDFDLLVAMPTYLGPGARRSWDPIATILAELSAVAGPLWPVGWDLVSKRSETAPMRGASLWVRRHTAADQLRRSLVVADPAAVAGRRVLIVDDVLAEGSTLREVARALRRSGAREVAGLVLVRPEWRGGP
jgi:predicted amidophosphoribosyltransferase